MSQVNIQRKNKKYEKEKTKEEILKERIELEKTLKYFEELSKTGGWSMSCRQF